MIVDLSFPHSRSVNEGISKTLCSLSYSSVDTAVSEIMKKGRGTTLSKNDLKDAYRIVPVHPQDMKPLAITWQGSTYIERALPFGLRSAPKIFTAVSDMITWPLHCRGLQHQIHYLVFFLFLSNPAHGDGAQTLRNVLNILDYLGVPVSTHKIEGPSTSLTFLGIEIDTMSFELYLPASKVICI